VNGDVVVGEDFRLLAGDQLLAGVRADGCGIGRRELPDRGAAAGRETIFWAASWVCTWLSTKL
jgi:hypothetical protein